MTMKVSGGSRFQPMRFALRIRLAFFFAPVAYETSDGAASVSKRLEGSSGSPRDIFNDIETPPSSVACTPTNHPASRGCRCSRDRDPTKFSWNVVFSDGPQLGKLGRGGKNCRGDFVDALSRQPNAWASDADGADSGQFFTIASANYRSESGDARFCFFVNHAVAARTRLAQIIAQSADALNGVRTYRRAIKPLAQDNAYGVLFGKRGEPGLSGCRGMQYDRVGHDG